MRIIVNGEPVSLSCPATVEGLIGELRVDPRRIAVERNLAIVPKSQYAVTALADGDRLEIVHFVSGG